MAAVKFICKTNSKKNHEAIKGKVYMAGGAILREKIYRDTSSVFESEMEIVSEGGTLYRDVKENGFSISANIVN